ncbi:hypothetical protein LTR37_001990 [Vermiconidia calcicola]|uniref:Uncharacterized protein n=1 Tax=Vermiconidia calcicola TaxID=1690605 RepID=A0ACC3NU96_9PEZI|nr:hypothetical protein LTR37_001990 [Vermiconidia calcicola]
MVGCLGPGFSGMAPSGFLAGGYEIVPTLPMLAHDLDHSSSHHLLLISTQLTTSTMYFNRLSIASVERKLRNYFRPIRSAVERKPPRRALPRDDPDTQVSESDEAEEDSDTNSIDWVFVEGSHDDGNDEEEWEIDSVHGADADGTSGIGLGITEDAATLSYIDEFDMGECSASSWENVPSMTEASVASLASNNTNCDQELEASALLGGPKHDLFLPTKRLPPGTSTTDPILRQHLQIALSRRFDEEETLQCSSDEVSRAIETPVPKLRYTLGGNIKAQVGFTKFSEAE